MPVISVVLPVYNRVSIVRKAIESVICQTYHDWELLISDNASSDGTQELIARYAAKDSRIRGIYSGTNEGPVRNWIRGIREATGEYTKVLWSDDWIADNFLEETLSVIRSDELIAFAYAPVQIVGRSDAEVFYNKFSTTTIFPGRQFVEGCIFGIEFPLSPGCALFRTECLKDNVRFDIPAEEGMDFNRYGAGSDLLMYLLPLLDSSRKVAYTAQTRAFFLAHKDSFSVANDLSKYYEYARIYFVNRLGDKKLSTRVLLRYYESDLPLKQISNYARMLNLQFLSASIQLRKKISLVARAFRRVLDLIKGVGRRTLRLIRRAIS